MESGTLAKVLHDFLTTVEGELSLCKGEYFLVHKVIDKHWCYGQSHNRTGNFPASHLHKVDIPQLLDSQSLFVSIAAFTGEQAGDLSFREGELIVGIREVGSGWYLGQIDSRVGIFPTTHTWQLEDTLIKKGNSKKTVHRRAKVKVTLKAQLPEELDLTEGDIVTVTEVLDDGWCYGQTEDGRNGTFPEGFISYIDDDASDQTDVCSSTMSNSYTTVVYNGVSKVEEDEPAPSYYDLFPEFCASKEETSKDMNFSNNVNSFDVKPYAITLYPFHANFPNELSFGAGEVIHLVKYIDSEWIEGFTDKSQGIFPASYVNIIVNCSEIKNEDVVLNQERESTEYSLLEPETMVKVEYTFKAQMDGDLSISEGDVVTVVEMANQDWVNVKNNNGIVGLCPRAYLSPMSEPTVETNDEVDLIDDFVVLRSNKPDIVSNEEEPKPKRLSEPHRPAPPVPAPGRTPLQKRCSIIDNSSERNHQNNVDRTSALDDVKQKNADQRQNVISELVLTEKEYVRDLKLTYETFHLSNPSFLESKGINVTVLFGNILEVIQTAEELLDLIQRAMKGCDEELQQVGPCFLKVADKLRIVYGKYCGNHEAALVLLKKYENNEEIMTVFNKGTETLRYQIACFDMSSILIKPVQRILKYPLILYELVKCTESNHPDKQTIEDAWKAMTNVASYINEYKRRKDMISKYLETDNTLISKMSKINMHSVAKMSTRLSTRLSASLGLTNVAVDSKFEEMERQFRHVEKCTLQLKKDVEQCISYLKDEANYGKTISEFLDQYYEESPNMEIKRLKDTRLIIWQHFIQDLESCLERRVITPINLLATLLEGPAVLITKRHDKLLDYDAAISRSEKYKDSKIVQEELFTAKNNFEAMNQQLLEELPILIDAATNVLVNCIKAFANTRKLLSGKITKKYLILCETTDKCTIQLSAQDILGSFLVTHNLLWNQITRFTFAGANPRIEEEHAKWYPQSENQRTVLRNKYPRNKLYVVTENVLSTSSLDMGASRGTLVAVIKSQDPAGDTSRWFVDNGSVKGFLPANKLSSISQEQQTNQTHIDVSINANRIPDLISMDSPEKETKSLSGSNLQALLYMNIDEQLKTDRNYSNIENFSETQPYQNVTNEVYYAMYDFAGDMPGTLSITRGQAVKLIRPHDEKGNDEWWLVTNRHGGKGYVPRNYLGRVSMLNH